MNDGGKYYSTKANRVNIIKKYLPPGGEVSANDAEGKMKKIF
jgi:hypothetical protein